MVNRYRLNDLDSLSAFMERAPAGEYVLYSSYRDLEDSKSCLGCLYRNPEIKDPECKGCKRDPVLTDNFVSEREAT